MEYKFEVIETEIDSFYIAELFIDGEQVGFTQGRDKEELFEMVADAFMTAEDIEIGWYKRLIHKIFRV